MIQYLLTAMSANPQLDRLIVSLGGLGIDVSPRGNSFIRYYPPLRTLPKVDGVQSLGTTDTTCKSALFVYIPFCTGSCSYCFYVKKTNPCPEDVGGYLDSLEVQAGMLAEAITTPFSSAYIGGGTPSFLDVRQIRRLFSILDGKFGLEDIASFTFEASPETLDEEKIGLLGSLGVKRISLGVQSLDDYVLKSMRRRYTKEEVFPKIDMLRRSGLSYNLDFIFGLQMQGASDVEDVLDLVRSVEPPSVTFYQRWSSMYDTQAVDKHVHVLDRSRLGDILESKAIIEEAMLSMGYSKDSLFRFIKSKSAGCGYCKTVWEDNSCLALGPSAYSYIDGLCFQNTSHIDRFRRQLDSGLLPIERLKRLTGPEMASRALILGLKTAGADSCGVSIDGLQRRYDVTLSEDASQFLDALSDVGAILSRQESISFTREGSFFAENILNRLIRLDLFYKT